MEAADIRAPLHAVPTPDRTGERNQSKGRATDRGRESAIQTASPDSGEAQPVVYGELLSRASGLARKAAVAIPGSATDEPPVYATHAAISRLSYRRAIDVYQTLQTHATAQVLSPVYRIDLYA